MGWETDQVHFYSVLTQLGILMTRVVVQVEPSILFSRTRLVHMYFMGPVDDVVNPGTT